jgi:multidrug resistance efflux pump
MVNAGAPPLVSPGRRLRRFFSRHFPAFVWTVGAIVAGWLYIHERPRGQAIATADVSEVKVISEASGRILRLAVQEGQSVREGETIAVLDSRDLDERIERARAILDRLRSVAGSSPDEAKLYELKVAELQKEKEKYTLVARASGRIENLLPRTGDWLSPGSEVAVIEAGKPGRVTAYLTEPRPPTIVRGTRTLLRPRSKSGVTVPGRVTKVSAHIEQVPARLHHEAPSLSAWGRSVTIELDRAGDFSPGEIYDVSFVR